MIEVKVITSEGPAPWTIDGRPVLIRDGITYRCETEAQAMQVAEREDVPPGGRIEVWVHGRIVASHQALVF
jgi:hypothetical protein